MWASGSKTEEVRSRIRERWRRVPESRKESACPPPLCTDRRDLSVSRQRPEPGAARSCRAGARPDAARRSPLRHRKRPVRLRSGRAQMDAKTPFPDAAAGRMAGGAAHPFRRCEQRPDDQPERRDRGPRRSRNRRRPRCHRTVLRHRHAGEIKGPPKDPHQPRPQLFGRRPQSRLDHQSGKPSRHREHGRASRSIRCASAPTSMSRAGRPGTNSSSSTGRWPSAKSGSRWSNASCAAPPSMSIRIPLSATSRSRTELMRRLGHADCGIYAEVIAGGDVSVPAIRSRLMQPELL